MPAYIDKDGAPVEILRGVSFVDRDGTWRPGDWLARATPEEIAAAGIVEIAEPPAAPEGSYIVPGAVEVEGEGESAQIVRRYEVVALAPPEPTAYRIVKADIWRRATEAEAERMDAALNAAPVRLRRAYDAAQFIASDDTWFDELQAGIAAAVGEKRAAELLAPSDGAAA